MTLKVVWCWGKTDEELDEVMARVTAQNGGDDKVKAKGKAWSSIYHMIATKEGDECPEMELDPLPPPSDEHEFVGLVIL